MKLYSDIELFYCLMSPLFLEKGAQKELYTPIVINGITYVHCEDLEVLFKYALNFYEKLFKKGGKESGGFKK